MPKRTSIAPALAALLLAAPPLCFAQNTSSGSGAFTAPSNSTSNSALGSSPGSTLGASPGLRVNPGIDTTLPGSRTTPGLSTLPGLRAPEDSSVLRSTPSGSASFGSSSDPDSPRTLAPLAPVPRLRGPGSCTPGSLSNPC